MTDPVIYENKVYEHSYLKQRLGHSVDLISVTCTGYDVKHFSTSHIEEVCLCLAESYEPALALASEMLAVLSPVSHGEWFAKVLGTVHPQDIINCLGFLYEYASRPMQTLEELHMCLSNSPTLAPAFYELTLYLISLNLDNIEEGLKFLFKFTTSPTSTAVEPSKLEDLARCLARHCSGRHMLNIIVEFSRLGVYLEEISKQALELLLAERQLSSAGFLLSSLESRATSNPFLREWLSGLYRRNGVDRSLSMSGGGQTERDMQQVAETAQEVDGIRQQETELGRQLGDRDKGIVELSNSGMNRSNDRFSMQHLESENRLPVLTGDIERSFWEFSMEEALLPQAKVHYSYKKDTNVLYWTNIETAETFGADTSMTFLEGCSYVDIPDPSKLFFTGGEHSKTATFFELENFNCSFTTSMIGKRSFHGSFYFEGKVYVIGGQKDPKHYTETCECFDLERKVWTQLSSMPDKLSDFTPIVTEGKVYILGGRTGKYSNKILSYDISSDVWEVLACKIPIKDCSFPCFRLTMSSTLIYFVQDSCLWTFDSRQTQVKLLKKIKQRNVYKDGGPCYVYANRLYSPCDEGASSVVRL
jgi:hypothetical protein